MRDGNRLGLWVNAALGGWLFEDVTCIPALPGRAFCDHTPNTVQPLVEQIRCEGRAAGRADCRADCRAGG